MRNNTEINIRTSYYYQEEYRNRVAIAINILLWMFYLRWGYGLFLGDQDFGLLRLGYPFWIVHEMFRIGGGSKDSPQTLVNKKYKETPEINLFLQVLLLAIYLFVLSYIFVFSMSDAETIVNYFFSDLDSKGTLVIFFSFPVFTVLIGLGMTGIIKIIEKELKWEIAKNNRERRSESKEGNFIQYLWSEIEKPLRIISIPFLLIFSIREVSNSIYKSGFNCIEKTLTKEDWRFEDEIGKKENYRKAKLICLEKINGKNYGWKKSKEHEQKSKDIIQYLKSDKYQKLKAEDSISKGIKKRISDDYYYHDWAESEYSNGRYPEPSHFNPIKYRAYLNKIIERRRDNKNEILNAQELYEQKRKDRLEFGF